MPSFESSQTTLTSTAYLLRTSPNLPISPGMAEGTLQLEGNQITFTPLNSDGQIVLSLVEIDKVDFRPKFSQNVGITIKKSNGGSFSFSFNDTGRPKYLLAQLLPLWANLMWTFRVSSPKLEKALTEQLDWRQALSEVLPSEKIQNPPAFLYKKINLAWAAIPVVIGAAFVVYVAWLQWFANKP